jgi:arylsulfatase A-like enzyme
MKSFLLSLIVLLSGPVVVLMASETSRVPNVLVLLADDLGYADVGFQGCQDIPTPNLDKLAARSLRCTNGYVSHPFCSPTRAGLLSGRYQQRFGHENNPAWLPDDPKVGLPLSQSTIAQVLGSAGYRTGCVGKWHLGAHPSFHPNKRGFDEYFGLLGGGHVYLPGAKGGVEYTVPLDRNGEKEKLSEYLTDVLGKEGAAFIQRHKREPWFLYLAFNAPHTPLQATDPYLERVKHIKDETRRKYAALTVAMDDAIGVVLEALRATDQENDTLVWFFSDNGGPVTVTHANNTPLRGAKGSIFEGGMRVPFLISWPGQLPQGKDYQHPVSSLDVFATAAAVAGAKVPANLSLDGINLLPYLKGDKTGTPHDRLFWRTGGGQSWAVREGDWKLASPAPGQTLLFNLKDDVGETKNLADSHPDLVAQLRKAYETWNRDNVAPLFEMPGSPKK